MRRFFGTDGIRAVAGQFPLDYTAVYNLGKALMSLLVEKGLVPAVLIGQDTRESGQWLEQALFHGILETGGKAVSAGVIPTSAVSFLTKSSEFSAGIMISASHNPYEDNGIKIFSSKGVKIPESWEKELERAILPLQKPIRQKEIPITPDASLSLKYTDFLQNLFSEVQLPRKIKIVLDCSNGASSAFAPELFSHLGFEVLSINTSPNGKNINAGCGSLHPDHLAREVLIYRGDLGIAYDGDADRAIWVDEKGQILNGDHTLFVLSRFMHKKRRLKSDTVVATTMSNMGLEKGLEKLNLKLHRTQVGDKYVLESMKKLQTNLGGEQSGHTIFLDDCPTGDGMITSLKMLEVMAAEKASLSELTEDFEEYPQILTNVRVSRKEEFKKIPEIRTILEEIQARLGDSGRMNVRYSGTEPVARIMIEGEDREKIEKYARQIAGVIEKHLGE